MVKSKRGFASMTPKKHRELARLGGIASQKSGNAHKWTPEEARAAGRIGGRARHRLKPASA
jgi:uncharacterized protein